MIRTPDICTLFEPIVRTLAYYDLFDHPLRTDEIHLYLPAGGVSLYELEGALAELVADGRIMKERGFYYLPHQNRSIVQRRIEMEERGARLWRVARRVAWVMRFTPFIRGVFISGQLCRYVADVDSDIDYFVVTTPGRLWIVRTIFVLVRRTLLLNSRTYFCTNYYVTTENLAIRERNPYVACEVASLKPLYNRALFDEFLHQNAWVTDFYPNFTPERIEIRSGVEGGVRLRRFFERLVPSRLAAYIDRRLMMATRRFWRRKFPDLGPYAFDQALRSRSDESRAHPHDQAPIVLERYRERLEQYGIIDG